MQVIFIGRMVRSRRDCSPTTSAHGWQPSTSAFTAERRAGTDDDVSDDDAALGGPVVDVIDASDYLRTRSTCAMVTDVCLVRSTAGCGLRSRRSSSVKWRWVSCGQLRKVALVVSKAMTSPAGR